MELGVFIPIGNNGWLISTTSPQYLPSFDLNLEVGRKAERFGFDFALSMIKLHGFGGLFGIAYSHAAGHRQCILDGALTKRMQAGQAASAGVFSAVLAQTGFTGARNIFNGRFGFLELYQPNGYDASVLLRALGTAYRGEALS